MTGKKSRPYDRAVSRICFLAASSSGGKAMRSWEGMRDAPLRHLENLTERQHEAGQERLVFDGVALVEYLRGSAQSKNFNRHVGRAGDPNNGCSAGKPH